MPGGATPGAALLDLVAVMDRLRSPGGCPWDAEQTHATLAPYLLEESYETVEAIASGDRDHLVEELGDVLLQVVFHARVGQEHPEAPFDIDDVAAGIAAKLRRRHPHVFGDVVVGSAEEVSANWEQIKADERAQRVPRHTSSAPRAGAIRDLLELADELTRAGGDPERVLREALAARSDAVSVTPPHAPVPPSE
ncbi:MAG TPA: MazG family protein [Dermatophilaceae bacterium]|nr:MazG family protein [Dermatophilaceae bacterium]